MLNISVIIPVYNAEKFLEKAVDSALYFEEVKEILLIEDASRDQSLLVCQNIIQKNPRVKLFQHKDKGNHGAGATRNLGLDRASQEFIAFLDADDYYLPNRFDAERELFKNENIEGVFGAIGTEFLTERGKQEFLAKFKNIQLTTVNYAAEGEEVFKGLLGLTESIFGSFFTLNALTIRNNSLGKINLRFNENLRVHQDSDFIIKLAYLAYLKSGIIDEAIAIRGVHDENRITKIVRYSAEYNERQFLLWESLYKWAYSNNVNRTYRKSLFLTYKSFQLSLTPGFSKYIHIIINMIRNPMILKSRYRFTYLN